MLRLAGSGFCSELQSSSDGVVVSVTVASIAANAPPAVPVALKDGICSRLKSHRFSSNVKIVSINSSRSSRGRISAVVTYPWLELKCVLR